MQTASKGLAREDKCACAVTREACKYVAQVLADTPGHEYEQPRPNLLRFYLKRIPSAAVFTILAFLPPFAVAVPGLALAHEDDFGHAHRGEWWRMRTRRGVRALTSDDNAFPTF